MGRFEGLHTDVALPIKTLKSQRSRVYFQAHNENMPVGFVVVQSSTLGLQQKVYAEATLLHDVFILDKYSR